MKLFYRPAGLKGNPADAYKQLVWSSSGGKVQVSNSSPYNVVLAQVNISGKEVKNDAVDFVPAKGTLNITLPANTNAGPGSKVAFKIISDFGGNSGPYNASVQ
jgi:fimbrial chaperone protein